MKTLLLAVGATAVLAQPAPTFTVASIKRNLSGNEGSRGRIQPGGRVSFTNEPLRRMILDAYQLQDFQLVGGPDWVQTDRWDVVAKADGDPPFKLVAEMMRTLLAERFKLIARQEMRDAPDAENAHRKPLERHQLSSDASRQKPTLSLDTCPTDWLLTIARSTTTTRTT